MGARVTVFGRVATADMAAFQAHAQVNPGVAGLQAIFAALCRRFHWLDVIFPMSTGCHSGSPLRLTLDAAHEP
jgi:hypothetical protein